MKIIFSITEVFNKKKPISNCLYNVLNELLSFKNVEKIIIINLHGDDFDPLINSRIEYLNINLEDKEILNFTHRVFNFLKRIFYYPIKNFEIINLYTKNLTKKIYSNPSDFIFIGINNHLENLKIGIKLKKKFNKMKLYFWLLDPIYNDLYSKRYPFFLKKLKLINLEKKYFKVADKIISMIHNKEHFLLKHSKFLYKTYFLGFPLLLNNELLLLNPTYKDKINVFSYFGSFDITIRDPSFMFSFFKSLMNYKLLLYTDSTFVVENKDIKYEVKKLISGEELSYIIKQSDFLLSVGNYNSYFFPSKIIFYLNFNKKIIHFSNSEDDPIKKIFDKIPTNILILYKNDSIEVNLNKFNIFIKQELVSNVNLDNFKPYATAKTFLNL